MTAWVTAGDVIAVCPNAVDDAALAQAIEAASDILYDLSGQRWPGPQADVVRPCTPLVSLGRLPGSHYSLALAEGSWGVPAGPWGPVSGWCGCEGPAVCGCATPSAVELPGTPATSVEQVTLDAVVLDPALYRLVGQLLVRADGGRWPCCQDLAVAGDQPGGFEVRYTWGVDPPAAGEHAAAVLACELYRATSTDPGVQSTCRLPKRVTSITRQGVTMAMLDPMQMFPDGMTGIPEVDLWLGSVRYADSHRPSTVMVPGSRRRNLRDATLP